MTIYLDEQRFDMSEEERLRDERRAALESLRDADLGLPPAAPMRSATDVMAEATGETPRMHEGAPVTVRGPGDPAAAARAQRIADTDPAEWARQRDAGRTDPGPVQLPEQQIAGRPSGSVLEVARQRVQQAPASPAEARQEIQRAAQERDQGPADPSDPALSNALAESKRSRILRAVGSILGAGAGWATPQFHQASMARADEPLQRYAQQRAMLDRQEDRTLAREDRTAAQERQAALDAQRAEQAAAEQRIAQQRLGLQERGLEQRAASDERQGRLDEARLGLLEAQRAAEEGDAASQAALTDPTSDISRGTQDLYLDMLRESRGGDVPPQIEAAVRSQPARVLMENDALRTSIQGGYSVRRSRRGGSGAGGGLGSRGRGASQALRHYQQALDVTGDPDAAAAATQEAFPGFEPPGGGQGEQLSPRQRSEAARWAQMNIAANIPEVLSMMRPAEQAIQGASDGEIREAVGIINGGTLTREVLRGASPRAAAIAQSVMQLSNVELRRVSGAAVSDQEFERFKQGIGTNSLSPDVLRRGLAAMRRNVEANARQIDAGFPGISDYVQRQREEARGGGQRRQGGGSRVRVRYQGRVLEIPRSRLEQAQADGAEVVE